MSMRDKAERDRLSNTDADFIVRFVHNGSLKELLDIADERDELAEKLKQEKALYVLLHNVSIVLLEADKQKTANIQKLQAELTQEQNATQEWRVVAEGMEKENIRLKAKLAEIHREYGKAAHIGLEAERDINAQLTSEFEGLQAELSRQKAGNKKLADRMIYAEAYLESHMDTFNEVMKNSVALKEELERLRNCVPGDVVKAIEMLKCHAQVMVTDRGNGKDLIETDKHLKALIGSLIERKRDAVPVDVEKEIEEYFDDFRSGSDEQVEKAKNRLITFVGSLIERKREDLEEAFKEGGDHLYLCNDPTRTKEAAKAYADRKIKEVK